MPWATWPPRSRCGTRTSSERGLGELNFPPDYPKMPGEPPRVQPSKRRKDKSDEDYMPPKAERDADLRSVWGPVMPPVAPMLAKPVKGIPTGDYLFEPKWDGFRSIIFRSGDQVEIGSRNEKPMTRYFPEVVEAVLANFPEKCVVDGEIVLIGGSGDRLDFDALQHDRGRRGLEGGGHLRSLERHRARCQAPLRLPCASRGRNWTDHNPPRRPAPGTPEESEPGSCVQGKR